MDFKRKYFAFLVMIGVCLSLSHLKNVKNTQVEIVEIEESFPSILPDKAPWIPEEILKHSTPTEQGKLLKPPPDFLFEVETEEAMRMNQKKIKEYCESQTASNGVPIEKK
ncbi:MAG: hypothetical protein HQM08_25755 [Candidatus Riflebacteria bacterium]|nr:hypothetical protein [Candidatus Riflebacteria bacterium]